MNSDQYFSALEQVAQAAEKVIAQYDPHLFIVGNPIRTGRILADYGDTALDLIMATLTKGGMPAAGQPLLVAYGKACMKLTEELQPHISNLSARVLHQKMLIEVPLSPEVREPLDFPADLVFDLLWYNQVAKMLAQVVSLANMTKDIATDLEKGREPSYCMWHFRVEMVKLLSDGRDEIHAVVEALERLRGVTFRGTFLAPMLDGLKGESPGISVDIQTTAPTADEVSEARTVTLDAIRAVRDIPEFDVPDS